jgi:hypothetical protein
MGNRPMPTGVDESAKQPPHWRALLASGRLVEPAVGIARFTELFKLWYIVTQAERQRSGVVSTSEDLA